MADIISRLAELSPEKQRLLALKLKLKGDAVAASAGHGGGERPSEFPASFAQRRMWLLDRLEPGSTAYSMPRVWRIPGPLDVAALERAVDELVRRHETLRTHLEERGEEPVQVVAPPAPFRLEVTDLSALAPGEARAELERLAHADASAPFRLEEGPLFRASLVRLAADDHALLWNLHHAVTDGWSTGILARELKALYQAFSRGQPSPLAPLPLQYGDHALRERERLSGDALARLVGFWRDALEGAPTRLEIAPDRPRPPVRTYRGASVSASLGAGLPARVDALARAHDATPFMVYLAAFQLLLGRYARQDDVLVGTAVANRATADVEGIVGFFVNTLVLRGDLSGDPTFAELLGRVREITLGAFEHQALPFEKLVEELNPERSLTHAPLVQAVIVLHNQHSVGGGPAATAAAPAQAAGPALRLEAAGGAEEEAARFDLTLELAQGPDGVHARLSYATDLFERGTALRMLGHLARVLEQVAADADVRLSQLELLGEAERVLVLEEWNRTAAEYPADRCIHELFEAQAARTPDAVAVDFAEETLRYGELNERANQLAHHLAGLGVGPEVRVGICLERGTEMIVSVLAVLKAGGAYVPLDPAYPAERLAFVLSDAAVPVLVTQESLRAALPAGDGVAVVSVDGDGARIAAESAENPERGVLPDHLAYVIYTSGSTGRPKGVMVPHRGVPNLAYAQARRFGIDGTSRVLQFASPSFDAVVAEVFDALLTGATLVMASRDELLPGAGLLETLRRGRVTVATLPPSVLAMLPPDDLPELRTVVSAGEAVDAATVERWSGGRAFVNAYGPTETTVCATSARCEADGRAPVIGRPLENARVYVLDAAGRPAPVGVPGELYVGGVGVARGYLGRPGLTAEKFVPDPFGGETGARLYRTGDRVRWSARGELEFLGRVDEQVKVRGFRIEPGEIEAVLSAHAEVREARVIVREDAPGEQRLVAYVVGDVEAGVLREHLLRQLPEYMVPSAFVVLEVLPLTPNGKLDRKALPAPTGDAYARRSYEAPLGEVEAALAEIWAEVLGVERVGRWDHFFELGGHSLLAIKLIGRMRRVGLHTDVRALFTTPVLAELALAVGGASPEMEIPANGIPEGCEFLTPEMLPLVELSQAEIDGIVAGVPGGAANVQDIYPLAPLQEGFLFHHLLSEEGDPYLTPTVTEFDTRARLEQYLGALQAVIDRHDILRTAVAWEGLREPVQVVWRHAPLPVEEVELDAGAEDAAEQQLWRRYDPRHYRMDLGRAPLLRASIAEDRARGRWLLLTLMHHLMSDHESLEVQREEISAHLRGRESELPAPLPFRDYVARARLGVSQEEHERFFRGMLGDVEEPTAPYGLLDVWGEGHGIGEAWLPVAGDLGARLRRRARALGVSAASLFHLAWAQVLARLSGREDVVFGTLLFGRMQGGEGADRVLGPLINTLPVRIGVGEEGVEAAVRRTHALLADLLRHEHASLALAQRSSGVAAPAPLFTSLLNYRYSGRTTPSQEAGQPGQPGEGARSIGLQERTNYPVALSVNDLGEAFSLVAQVAAPAEAERVCRMMHTALAGLVEALEVSPRRAIGSIDVLPEAERRVVVEEWNRTEAEYPADRCIHELFEAQVERTPGAVALVFGDETLSYAELNERANRLAHHLAGLGVGPETRVGICLERGPEMIVSVLAVLKAGGAYVPLDPAYPAERLAFVLADAAVPVLVTQESLRAALPAGDGVAVVSVDGDGARIAAESAENPERGVLPDHLAYVIHTSGSTGTPKGVMVPHRGVPNLAYAQARRFRIDGTSRVLQFASLSFDAAVAELLDALLAGATLVLASREALLPGPGLLETLRRGRVTVATLPPSVLAILPPDDLPELRTVVSAGEAVDAATVERWSGGRAFVNAYGPTETTVCAASARCEADGRVPAIGRALENVRVYVLDAAGRPAPVGVPGELYVGGVGVARGYLGRPGLTAERFVPDPFSVEGGARLYRTGDRVRWSAWGELEFLGRVDAQVKVRGFRIEPGEIEGALRRSEGVADCVVVAREDVPGEKRLVAYVVGDVEAGVLREHLLRELPEYMVPSAFVVLEALPLTPNGKLDRKALPAPEGDAYARAGYEAPLGEVEAALAEIWAEVLGLERVGRWDHFFELGGHSLLAIRLIERMRRAGLHTDVRALFTTPVLAELALAVGGASPEMEVPANGIPEGCEFLTPEMLPLVELSQAEIDRIVAGVPGGAANVQDIYPLAPLQEGFLFHHLLSEEGDPYLTPSVTEFDTRARLEQYLAALQAVIDRHDVLRTAMTWEGLREPVQVVWRQAPLPVEEVELDAEAGDAAGQLWRRYDPRRYRMDLGRAPMRRAYIAEDRARGRWLLLMLMHHLTSDHESLEVQREEISAHLLGRESELPAPLPFRNYVARARLGSREEHERFFRGLLGDVEEPTAPYGLLDVRGEGLGIGEAWLPVAGDLAARLRRGARALGVTAASLFHLAWAQVLARLSGREDVVFGTLLFGRMQGGEGADRVMGPLINTLPVRIGVGEEGAEAAVRRTHALLADLLRYEHASLALAQRCSGVAAPAPLFTSLLNYRYSGSTGRSQQAGQAGQAGQAREGMRGIGAQERTNYPVMLSVDDWGEAFSLSAQVAAPAEAERVCRMMHTALERLVEALEVSPGRAIGSLDVLPEAERGQVVEEWNRTDAEYPAGACIHELFEVQAERTPDAVAVRFEEKSLTYAELNARANRLAHHLRSLGVGPDARVAVCVERSAEMVVALLAVMKAGGAYVPLDPSYPAERLRYVLHDSAPAAVLTQRSLDGVEALFAGVEAPVIDLEGAEWARCPETDPGRAGLTPGHLAYVIYTSGSTGRPKGVAVPHRGVVNLLGSMRETVGMEPADRLLAVTTYAFDISVLEIFLPLLHGAATIVLPRERAGDPAALAEAIRAYAPTVMQATPATWRMLVSAEWEGASGMRALCGGEALPAELASAVRSRVGALWNVYGPTETTIWSTSEAVRGDAAGSLGGQVPIGRPVANTRVYVLDGAGEPVPVGVAGELYIGGAGVVRGYLGRPEQTAERFVADPFGGEPGARMYRTGDLARWRPDGTIEFLGRTDFQVKVRGFRIELGEIEARLAEHADVREAVVLAREDVPGDQRLVAYVVGEAEAEVLRDRLRRTLPEYMVPSAFVFLDALPLTPNGKLDRKALPAPEGDAYARRSYKAPLGEVEAALAEIWAEVLGVERVGRWDHFFDLGGHSLLATRVAARGRGVFGVDLPLRAVFERPVLSELAAEIDHLRGTGAAAGEGAIAPAAREGDLPVTFAQERLWFVDALDPGSPVYAMPFSYGITGRLDHDALRRALAELVRRHEPLRTTLPAVDGVPVQRIAPPPAGFDLPVADLRHLPEGERRAEAGRLAAEAAGHRFDLARGPLFRASLVRVADAEHRLLLNLHHAVGDGWSVGVLREELSALYGAFSRGEPSPLPEPALQYADYAVWQRERLSGAALERQVEFWRRALDGAPALLELPTDRPRPPVESHRGAVEGLVVPPGLAAEVHALARREGATLFMVLLAALDVVLGRLAGQEDVVVGTPIAGRTRAETDRMVGLFLNSLALRTDLSGDPSFRELLGRVRETTLDAYAHQDVPFERVLEEVRPERSLAHAPVFQVMLNLLNFQDGAFRAEGLEVAGGGGGGGGGEAPSKFDLTLYVGERDGGIYVNLVYAADLFDAPRMRGLLAQLEGVLRQAAAAPETRLGALSLATEAARGVLPDPAEPLDETWRGAVHEVFAAQARRTPDALAVEDPRERWTYAELDAATDGVARALADAGAGVGDVVAITGHRSAALVRALVGTMKSGAAFLVLDPAYPAARLGDYVRIARPAAHLHLSAAADLPGEVAALLGETIRTRIVLHPRGDAAAEEVDGIPSSQSPVSVEVGPDTLAYLSFTSGTTGTPKAVMGRHSSLTHFTPWLASSFGLGMADRYSLLSGLAHDPLHRDVFTPLQLGASVVAPEPDEIGTPGYLARWMREAGITVAHLTPAMGQLLADAPGGERIPSLHRAFFVGDVLRRADVQRLIDLAPSLRVVNYYGSTETQRAVSYHVVDTEAEQKEIIPLGRGIPGVQLLVRTAAGELAGVGEVGEIWLRSPHLAAGYLNDPALAAERFLVNPWTGDPRDRLYRTGDLGRYRPDGEVEPLGRADQQVKVRGFRVELGEVESALAAHAAVKEAAVIARETEGGDRRLVAYWVPADDAARAESAALRAHLKALLPEYMVPSAYVRLDRLPLTQNGKLDRRALPEPESVATDSRPAAPRTPTEEILAQLWAEVLRVESVGVDDDFFALGGHSLLATRLLARVQNALGVVVPLRALFEGPTVAQLAVRVEALRRGGARALPPVVPVDRDRPLPLSFAQERLWFLDRLEGGSAAYNLPAALRLAGAFDAAALERALGEIVRRHESLRTFFREVDGAAVQVIAPFAGFALPIEDLSGLPETAREAEVRRRAREDAARPFDLAEGPLFRAALLRVADEEHVLLLCTHHIVSDGWSTGVLFRELGALYAAFARGEGDPFPPLPVQYADYAVWQREQLAGEVLDRQLAYWRERLAGAPALLELPTDRPRPPVQSHRGAREMFDLPLALLDRLQALGRSEGATLYMVMLGAFQLLLSKYSGSEDVVVGSPIAGRTRREVEELIGFFANTLVLRTDLSADPTFRELLGRVREGTLGAYENQEVPFERLVAELQPERSLSHSPLFQVMFTLQNLDRSGSGSGSGSGLAGLRMAGGVPAEVETTRFDLSLTAVPHDGGVYGALEYSTDLFDRSTVRRMLGHLARVLEQVAADADVRLSELELLSAEERDLVVDAWNRTAGEYPADRCIHELFEAQAARTPDAEAVAFEGERLTFAELNALANRLAHHLRERGVGPDARVAVCAGRGLEMVVGLLGVMKAGGAYVPLDPSYPAERLRYVLHDSAPAAVLTQRSLDGVEALFAGVEAPVIGLEGAEWARCPETDPGRAGLTPGHLAYVIYTSGSTGRPKGVAVPHRGVVNLLGSMRETVGMEPADRLLAVTTYAFDISVLEIFLPLLHGAATIILPRERAGDPAALAEAIRAYAPTVMQATPATWRMLVSAEWEGAPEMRALCGGEALPAELASAVRSRVGALWNVYGPTETTIWSTAEAVRGDSAGSLGGQVPVGRPVANTRVYVLDGAGEPVPVGVAGELYIGGAGVVRGYLGRPEQTAERFVADPFGGEPGARMYRTGDLARWRPDGTIEFLGRTDFQVKVRGFRIEPGEIEARLAEHPGVREAVVMAREDVPGDVRLVAYVVGDADAEALRAHLSTALPEYMVPAAYVRLETLPLTPNGKIDRKALPAPEGDAYATRGYEAPVGETERALAAMWAEVLGVERVGRWDGFFQLGGHSLLAVRVVSRVRQVLGVEVPLVELFRSPVLADLARAIENATRTELPPIERVDRGGRLPLSFAQQRLWFLEQLGDLGGTYHIPMRLRLQGELDRGALRRALDAVVARHEALRTTFAQVDGVPEQRIAPADIGFRLGEHDLSGQADAQAELGRLLAEEARAPFDLERGPLIRGRLVRVSPDDHVLSVTMHHIVSDAWSMELFTRELSALYGAFRRGEPDPLPALPVQYADYAAWQRRWVEGDVLQAQSEYWTEALAGAPALLELPTDHPRPVQMDYAGARLVVVLDEALTAGLKALGQRHGTTLFMTVLAGWAAVLGRLSGQEDVVVGTPTANRGRIEIEELIGFFVNTLALRVDLAGSPSVAEVLARVKERALGAQQNQDIPFEQVVELVQPARSMAHSPLFQVMFAWQNAPRGGLELPGLTLGSAGSAGSVGAAGSAGPASEAAAKFDLSLDLSERDGRIVGSVTYATSLFERATVERWVGYLRRTLEEMVADEGRPVERLALMPAGERTRVLEEWNRTEAAYPGESCIHEIFQAQVERTPDAVAVVFEDQRSSYAELNARANRLAHHLRSLGVGPDARVAVCVERSAEMVVALLAVMKAGGAYVPLDPGHPAERLEYMLADSAPVAVLTQKHFRDRVASTGVTVLEIDADGPEWADHPVTNPGRGALTPAHLAYVIYTSGSTGRPKGVAVPHRGVVNLLRSMRETVGMEPADRVLAVTTYAFDISVLEIFLPLLHGARTIVLPRERAGDPAALADAVRAHAPTVMQATPATWRMLVQAGWEGAPEMRALCGGEALPAELASALRSRVGALWNVYGPTETTIWSTAEAVRGDSAGTVGGQVPIGRPVANTRIYVLDAAGEPVPVGVAGELYIGGAGVVRGYLGRPEQTAERFVADPFGGEPGARMYRTGDLARWRPDGTVEFLGRTDFQVKVRGFRIELGEIEARLAEHADVREAVVLAREDVPGDVRLVAYWTPASPASAGPAASEALRAHLSTALPEYMVPAAYVRLETLPLTPNGKLDRKALPAPEGDAYASREYEAPVGKFEVALAEIWAELLRVERVGRWDDFFALGGHSLLALQVVSRVRQGMGVELALSAVFENPVLTALAERILELRLAQFDPETVARLAQLVREPGAETAPAREEPG